MKNEIVLFTDGDVNIEVQINPEQETVWLTQKQMELLFDVKHATVSEHISNILASGELDETSVGFSDRSTGGRKPKIYNLDMILSVGYRVNSKRGIAFRKWANNVLKQFILKGYAINEKRLQALKKTVDIQSRMLADALDIEEKDVLRAVNEYTDALILLDQYDHQALSKPKGSTPVYRITYEECVQMVGQMKDSFDTDVFTQMMDIVKKEDVMLYLLDSSHSIASQKDVENMPYYNMAIYQSMFESRAEAVEDIYEYANKHKNEILKFCLYNPSVDAMNQLLKKLEVFPVSCAVVEETAIEVTPLGITKGAGLESLSSYLNIPIENTIMIGDSGNDIEAFQSAGKAIAMGNATEEIKNLATEITLDNDHDGIKVIVDKYLL